LNLYFDNMNTFWDTLKKPHFFYQIFLSFFLKLKSFPSSLAVRIFSMLYNTPFQTNLWRLKTPLIESPGRTHDLHRPWSARPVPHLTLAERPSGASSDRHRMRPRGGAEPDSCIEVGLCGRSSTSSFRIK